MIVTVNSPNVKSISVLFKNIKIILENKDIILNNPDFYNVHIEDVSISVPYTGKIFIPLGVLIQLWEKGPWNKDGQYTFNITGSPLSGLCFRYCWDTRSESQIKTKDGNFIVFARDAFQLINKNKNQSNTIVPNQQKPKQSTSLQDILVHIATIKTK